MSVKIIACLNPASNKRTTLETDPAPIKDILNKLNSGFPLSQARVCRNGEIIKDFSLTAHDGDTLAVRFVPCGSPEAAGAGMKAGGWALMLIGTIITIATWGTGGFFGAMLIGTGLSMALGGTVLMNVNIPSLKDREKPDHDPSIRGAKNQARPHGRIPVLFGRHRVYPDIAANPYTEITGSQQFYIQLFCGGYKDYIIDTGSFKLGDTPLVDFSGTKDIQQILSSADPVIKLEIMQNGEASKLYPYCVHEETLNAPLQKEIEDAGGGKISGEIIKTTPDKTDKINIDIFFHNGLGRYNSDGDVVSAEVEVRAFYKRADTDEVYQPLGFFNGNTNVMSGRELKTKRYQITKQGLKPGVYSIKIERVTPDSSDSKVVDQVYLGSIRSFKTVDDDGNPVRPIRVERQRELTIIAMRVMATARLTGVLDSFNYVATSKLPVHSPNGSGHLYWLDSAQTRSPASMLLYALRGRASQQMVDHNDIDWRSIETFYAWCEEHGYTCNAYLSESVTIAELLRMIGNTSRADILRIDSKISVVQDIERSSPVQLFTPKNTISYSITMFNADIPDAISLRYIDENAGFAQNELPVYNTPDSSRADEPDTIQKVDLWGVTDDIQASRIGIYNYACLKNRPFVHAIEVDIEYLLCNKGDWIQYAGDIALTGSVQGRIKGIIWADGVCVGIDTDEPVQMEQSKQYAVRIRLSNGTIILKEAVVGGGVRREKSIAYYPVEGGSGDIMEPSLGDMYAVDEDDNVYYEPQNIILFKEPVEEGGAPKAGDVYAFGIQGYEVLDLIITDIQPGANFTAALTCVEYSPEIFGVDYPDFVLPEFVNRITPVSGAVDSGVVNPDGWRSFAVYHDSEEEPPRPSGNGQNGGWYAIQTFRSLWQSTKAAQSIETGEWGLPVRIKAERGTDDVTPVWLSLSPQNITLATDGGGSVLAALFPVTSQARLIRWNSNLSGVVFSLAGAPQGVSVNSSSGLITVSNNAVLGENNEITVRAAYQNTIYTSVLVIKKDVRNSPPRYLGTITLLPSATNAAVTIINGPVQGPVYARQGDYVLAVEAVGGRQAGVVWQWTGAAWQFRSPDTHSDLYIRCFKDGLDALASVDSIEWFGTVIARQLIAMKAFIEELQAQLIRVDGAIFGGDRFAFDNSGEIIDNDPDGTKNLKGFLLKQGKLTASGGEFSGELKAATGRFDGEVHADGGEFNNGTFTNITANTIDIDGNSIMRGDIKNDALEVAGGTQRTFFTSGYNVTTFWEHIRSQMGYPSTIEEFTVFPASGTISGKTMRSIFFTYHYPYQSPSRAKKLVITATDGAIFEYSSNQNPGFTSFTVGTLERTVKMLNLPTDIGPAGQVYKFYNSANSRTYLMIS